MKKRALSLLMAVIMVVSLLPTAVWAAEETDDWSTVDSPETFAAMTAAGKYKLTKDITVSAPYASNFTGIFDGDGHTITVNIKGNGLFSIIGDATIQNLKVDGIITGSSINVGGIVGKTQGAAKIDSCTFNGTVSSTSTNAKAGVGGIVGRVNTGTLTIINCYNTASVTSKKYAGGILGASTAAGTTITNCFNIGVISGTAGSGGIVGNLTNSKSSVSNCYWIQPEAGRGNGTAPINNGKTDSIVSVLDDLGSAFVKDKNGNVILAWESSGADVPKEPKILIKGDSALSMSNDGSVPPTTLTVEYKDMDDEPTVSWTTDSDIISLTAPKNAKENNAAVIVTANAPGKAPSSTRPSPAKWPFTKM